MIHQVFTVHKFTWLIKLIEVGEAGSLFRINNAECDGKQTLVH